MTKEILEKIESLEAEAENFPELKRVLHMLKDKTNTIMHMLDDASTNCPTSSSSVTPITITSPATTTTTSSSSSNPDLGRIY